MAERTSYPPGTFSWAELQTSDADRAKAFYGETFGWQYDDAPVPDGSVYTMALRDGKRVAALFESDGQPHWNCYVTVASADEAAKAAADHGATLVQEPFDVMDVGRMAVLADPQGAVFAVWEPRSRIGAERVNDLGCLTINELTTTDLGAARAFYGDLFGWATEEVDTGPGGPEIVSVTNDGVLNASMSSAQPGEPPHWRPYFTVESAETGADRVRELGGATLFGPIPLPEGGIAVARDPQGAVFALFAGRTDP
jgi:uncharacterized protein